jgi:hypothetical protein
LHAHLINFWFQGSKEVGTKSTLFWFVESQTHSGMPRGAKVRMALNEPKQVALDSDLNTTSEHAPQVESNY